MCLVTPQLFHRQAGGRMLVVEGCDCPSGATLLSCSSFPGPWAACVTQGVPAPETHAARRLKWRQPCSQHRSRRQRTSTTGRWFRRVNQQQPQRGLLPPALWAKIMCYVHRRKSFSKVKPGQGRQEGTQYRLKLYLRTFLFWTRISLLKTKKASLSNKAFWQWNYCNQLF